MAEKVRSTDDKSGQSLFDLVFPKNMRLQAGLTDSEAQALYNLWKGSPIGTTKFAMGENIDKNQILALKTKGYLVGYGDNIQLTSKGKKVIVEMATHEPNAFEKHAGELTYSGIKSKANTRPRQAFFKKQANKKQGKVFNLRKASVLRMGQNANNDNKSNRKTS